MEHREKLTAPDRVAGDQRTRPVGIEEGPVQIAVQTAEHLPVLHVVAVNHGIGVGEVRRVAAVQKDGAAEGELPVGVPVEIDEVVLTLEHGEVDAAVLKADPGHLVLADAPRILPAPFPGFAPVRRRGQGPVQPGLVLQDGGVVGLAVEQRVVQQGIAAHRQDQRANQQHRQVQEAV